MQMNAAIIFYLVIITGSMGYDRCVLQKKTGDCKASILRWYYNFVSGACEQFVYGGCKGNANNFESEADCKEACPNCSLPAESGFCRARFTNYYYDANDKRCKTFTYGGCPGNSNNFRKLLDCNNACKK